MKKQILILFFIAIGIHLAIASGDPRKKETNKGKLILVTPLVEGKITLYYLRVETLKSNIPEDPFECYTEVRTNYYLESGGNGTIRLIHRMNYKALLRNLMNDNPTLRDKIGEKGFLFHDLEKIIADYNNQ